MFHGWSAEADNMVVVLFDFLQILSDALLFLAARDKIILHFRNLKTSIVRN